MKRLVFFTILTIAMNNCVAQFSCAGLIPTNATYRGFPQYFTVPAAVTQVRINITGGSGGICTGSANTAGGGATVWAYITVVPGDVFKVIIGQKGGDGDFEAGGGGSSAVYKNGVLIMVAGGGGGEDNTGNGGNGVSANNGTNGAPLSGATSCPTSHVNDAVAGTGGNGGNPGEFCVANTNGGGGGGGINSSGIFKAGVGGLNMGGGQGNTNGTAGGAAGTNSGGGGDGVGANGGWGWSGGGGADHRESGAGGGYSGGGGAPEGGNPGGGGSFIAATGTNGITLSGSSNGTGTTTGANGSGVICATAAIVLPVQLGGFTAEKKSGGVLLEWTTLQELNTSHFVIEKSSDGLSFTQLSVIPAAGTSSSPLHYQYTDYSPVTDKVYYRLRTVDMDGHFSYSSIRFVLGAATGLILYPNPATEKIVVQVPQSWKNDRIQIQILNSSGQIVVQKNMLRIQEDVNLRLLPAGLYLLQAVNYSTNAVLVTRFTRLP